MKGVRRELFKNDKEVEFSNVLKRKKEKILKGEMKKHVAPKLMNKAVAGAKKPDSPICR